MSTNGALLSVTDLHKHFPIRSGLLFERHVGDVRAVDGVSFDVQPGETLGLVGESGSGKSTTGYCVLQLLKPTSGSVRFEGQELTELGREPIRRLRREMQIVFQDPYSSLDPRMTVGDIVSEPLVVHRIGTRRDRSGRVRELLDVRDLRTHLVTRWGTIRAVDGVSFTLRESETLGLVGESGSGKSMTCLSILRLAPRPAARILGGQVLLDGEDLLAKSAAEMQQIRGRKVSMILQDPMSSLNPVFSIGMQVREPIAMYHDLRGRPLAERAAGLLAAVGIPSPVERLRAFPHQLSGGMRQRVVGAMAISAPPRLLIADEPTTSLDLTIQAQYLRLLKEIQARHRLAMIFVTHNLGIVARMCDRVAVMYAGRIVETGPVRTLFTAPAHPYTRALLESVPRLGASRARLRAIDGQPPDLATLGAGCAFVARCPQAMERCRAESPPELAVAPGHATRCWLHAPEGAAAAPLSAKA